MATFIVNTASGGFNAGDGQLSIDEAFVAANDRAGADRIVFADGITAVRPAGALTVAAGEKLVVSGDTNGDGVADVAISGSTNTNRLWSVEEDARLTLNTVELAGAGVFGSGTRALMENRGEVRFDRAEITSDITGQDGTGGTSGVAGQDGVDRGRAPSGFTGANGGNAGDGGDGNDGAEGEDAALIVNYGSVLLTDTLLGFDVDGGRGGLGGGGGNGGQGGDGGGGGNDTSFGGRGADGGDGGAGGDGGDGGNGGRGGNGFGFLNLEGGTVTARTALALDSATASGGTGGSAGLGGNRGGGGAFGDRGIGGFLGSNGGFGEDGASGANGSAGRSGSSGSGSQSLAGVSGQVQASDAIVYAFGERRAVEEGGTLVFNVIRSGEDSEFSVDWEVRSNDGVTFSDVVGNQLLSGTLTFEEDGPNIQKVRLGVAIDDLSEGRENFTFRLSDVSPDDPDEVSIGTGSIRGSIRDIDPFTPGDDVVRLGSGNDRAKGLAGDDRIFGGGGRDNIAGNKGNDAVFGGAGNDRLFGGSGRDKIQGDRGQDVMNGGNGRDRFVFRDERDSGNGGRRDEIRDFDRGQDRIILRKIDAETDRNGNQNFDFIGRSGFSDTAGELRYSVNSREDFAVVSGDTDGDGRADFQIELAGISNLGAGDFLL